MVTVHCVFVLLFLIGNRVRPGPLRVLAASKKMLTCWQLSVLARLQYIGVHPALKPRFSELQMPYVLNLTISLPSANALLLTVGVGRKVTTHCAFTPLVILFGASNYKLTVEQLCVRAKIVLAI